jgi:pimeloyl-ACP methyl ester carboxylesterase
MDRLRAHARQSLRWAVHLPAILLVILAMPACRQKYSLAGALSAFPPELYKKDIISRDGSKIVFATNRSDHYSPYLLERNEAGKDSFTIWDLAAGDDRDFFPESFSKDGRLISLVSENLPTLRNGIYLYDLAARRLQKISRYDSVDEEHPVFSPVAEKLAFLSDGKLKIYDYTSGSTEGVPVPGSARFRNLIWSAAGKNLLLEDDSTNIWMFRGDEKRLTLVWKTPQTSFLANRFITPDKDDDERFYFISDHESEFNQIYKYEKGKVSLFISSPEDKFLIQRNADSGSLYYRINKDGDFIVKKWQRDSSLSVGPAAGVSYDYFPGFAAGPLAVYADLKKPGSLFLDTKGGWKEILGLRTTDSMPIPTIFHNKSGMINFVYRPKAPEKGWVVWLHGGPSGQMSMRFDPYLVQLLKAGFNLVVLNYPGSTGVGNPYEFTSLTHAQLLDVQLRTIREDILTIRSRFPAFKNYAIVGLSHGTIAAHAYAAAFHDEITKLIDLSGIVKADDGIPPVTVPTLYIYGEYDWSIRRRARVRLVEAALEKGNASRIILKNEGHIINHATDILAITTEINKFLE